MEGEIGHSRRASRWSRIALVAISNVIVLSSVGLYLFARDPYSAYEIRRLIEGSYNVERRGGGRLFRTGYSPLDTTPPASQSDLGRAQLLLLRYPDSERKQRLQALLHLAAGNWKSYVEAALHFSAAMREEPEVLNNLGASYLALSEK